MVGVSDEARNYILAKGGSVYLYDAGSVAVCCGRMSLGPAVRLGIPADTGNYDRYTVNGVELYVDRGLCSLDELTIGLGRFCGLKSLQVDGWKMI